MELTDYLRILRAHWIGVAAITVTTVLFAGIFSLTQPKVYAANATGFVSVGTDNNPALGSVADTLAKSRATSYVDLAQSRAVARQVIQQLGLSTDPSGLIGSISVQQPVDTVLLKITAKSSTPLGAQQLADSWVRALAAQVAKIEDPTGKHEASTPHVVPVESAALPHAPVSPNIKRNLMLALVLGFLLGLGYALIRSQLDRRLRSAEAVEAQFGVTVVGAIPATPELAHEQGEVAPIAVADVQSSERRSHAAESFRKLRTNVQFMDIDNPPRVIIVTSPEQGDGKSTVAANLAAALAVSGQTVTLVDGDLRRPSVASSFGLAEGAGLTDVLIGRADIADVIQPHPEFEGLSILAAGRIPPNPSELLGTQAMRGVLRKLAADGYVLVDAPPLLPVTDAAVLSAVGDGAFVVISSGKTLDKDLGSALGHLEAVKGRALGVIFNRVARGDTGSGYYGGYYEAKTRVSAESGASR